MERMVKIKVRPALRGELLFYSKWEEKAFFF
jgi:hypothetical protein